MAVPLTLVFCSLLSTSWAADVSFPSWFKFGTSTAAYQVEGAWNISGKSESIWDRFTHSDPTVIGDLTNGDVACDSYHNWQRDVDMAAEIGTQFYRFSISWTRLLPTGYSNKVNAEGAKYYSDLIDRLLENGIEPVVTLYHWDLPQTLQDLGGWNNPLVVHWFTSYVRVVFTLYADRVKTWITINEPIVMCDLAFNTGTLAPGIVDEIFASFLCNKHVLMAHGSAYRLYEELFKPLYHGRISISNHFVWYMPLTPKDNTLTKLARDFMAGRYAHAIYSKEGGWPPSMVKIFNDISFKEGYDTSRLPEFSKEEVDLVRGTYDFFALNYYTCRLVRRAKPGEKVDNFFIQGIPELRAVMEVEPGMPYGTSNYLVLCPKGLRQQMAWIKEQYGDVEILITENGYSTAGSDLKDEKRSQFIRDHLEQVLLSIKLDKVNVTGYTYWSLMDNFEWTDGYETKFGIFEVDFNSPERKRIPRASASYYSSIIRNNAMKINSTNAKYFCDE